jgi:transcriptional regulator with XRE-family HTH domain
MNLILERTKRKLTQRQLAQLVGVGVNTILKIESGNIGGVRFGILKQISEGLNMPFEKLFLS